MAAAGRSSSDEFGSFAKSFYDLFTGFFPQQGTGSFDLQQQNSSVAAEAAAEATQAMARQSFRVEPTMPPSQSFRDGSLHAVARPSGDFRKASASFSSQRNDVMGSFRQGPELTQPPEPPKKKTQPPTEKMTPYGPAPCPSVDSMVIQSDTASMLIPSCASMQARCPSMAMTPYGPAPHLGSFDADVWAEERRQQLLMHQPQDSVLWQRKQIEKQKPQLNQQRQVEQQSFAQEQLQHHQLQQMQHYPSADSETEDILDQHVDYYLRTHPRVGEKRNIRKKRPGIYDIDGREVKLDWEHNDPTGGDGFLVVIDGPMRQAFSDYVSGKQSTAVFDKQGLKNSTLQMVAEDSRMTFEDVGVQYSRLEAMKVAKEQAIFREHAAQCVLSGQSVPKDMLAKYEKVIDTKLGKSRQGYDNAKQQWSKKAREEGIPKMYPAHAPPGVYSSGKSQVNASNA